MTKDDNSNWTLCFPRGSSTPVLVKSPKPTDVPAYHILLKIDRFGFSVNNITYQALGEHPSLRYYDFYPAPEIPSQSVSPETHGVVPVWGFATVHVSSHPKVHVGERLYGYFAPTKWMVVPIDPMDVNKHAMYVPRPEFPPDRRLYHQIIRCSTDPLYTPETEDQMMIYRPLFWTSFWCEDWLFTLNGGYGCDTILVSSASSKTGFCFAYCVRNRGGVRIIGLTSRKNLTFTKNLGLYDEVYDYDTFAETGEWGKRWIYVDITGNTDLNQKIVNHFSSPDTKAGDLVLSVSLGATSTTPGNSKTSQFSEGDSKGIMGTASSTLGLPSTTNTTTNFFWPNLKRFFTPEWIEIRKHQIPLSEMFTLQQTEWDKLMKNSTSKGWIEIERVYGPDRVKESYERIVRDGLGPEKGLVWSLWEEKGARKARL